MTENPALDLDAAAILRIAMGSGRPVTAELMLAAAQAAAALESNRARPPTGTDMNALDPKPEEYPYVGEAGC